MESNTVHGIIGDHWVNDALRAWAQVLASVAWPAVVAFLIWVFRADIGLVIGRDWRFADKQGNSLTLPAQQAIDFEAPPDLKARATSAQGQSGSQDGPTINPMEFLRTRSVIAWEEFYRNKAAEISDPRARELGLITMAAEAFTTANFRTIDGTIFASQLTALERLRSDDTLTTEDIKTGTYNWASAVRPDFYSRFPFEQWLGYLVTSGLVQQDGVQLRLSDLGQDYLNWRFIAKHPLAPREA